MILNASLNTAIVLIVVGVVLYAIVGQLPPASRTLVVTISTVLVVLGVVDLLLVVLHP